MNRTDFITYLLDGYKFHYSEEGKKNKPVLYIFDLKDNNRLRLRHFKRYECEAMFGTMGEKAEYKLMSYDDVFHILVDYPQIKNKEGSNETFNN